MYRIVVDQSTTATKALLFDESKIIDRVDKKHIQYYPTEGYVEHDLLEILHNFKISISELLVKNNLEYKDIKGLSIANQRETIAVWDKETLKPLYNALVWQCERSVEICESLINKGYDNLVKEKTGLRIDSYFSGPKIKWLVDNVDEIREGVECGTVHIGTIDSFLIENLTGNFYCDITNACRTLLYDINEMCWSDKLCEIFGINKLVLPEVKSSKYNFGSYKGIEIKSVMADSQAALYGHRCMNNGDTKVTLGTGCSIMTQVGQINIFNDSNILTTICWDEGIRPNYALEGIIKSCGDTINFYKDQLGFYDNVEDMSEKAFKIDSCNGVSVIPAQLGLGAPFWNNKVRGSIHGIQRNTSMAEISRAILCSVAFQVKAVLDEMEKVLGIRINKINVDGGISKNNSLMQYLSNLLDKEVCAPENEELSAIGVLLIGNKDINFHIDIREIFTPQKSNCENIEYKRWSNIVNREIEFTSS